MGNNQVTPSSISNSVVSIHGLEDSERLLTRLGRLVKDKMQGQMCIGTKV
jgi:hypothetical protein